MAINVTGFGGANVPLKTTLDGSDNVVHHRIDGNVAVVPTVCAPTEVASGTIDEAGIAATANLRLMGFSVRENASTADVAETVIRHGALVGSPALAFVSLGADQSDSRWFGPDGIACAGGIFIERISGESHVVLYTKVQA